MSKHLHRTNRTTSSTPLGGELEEGEIGLGISTLGTSTNGFNNGRLYIKLANGDVKRFIGLGLPGTTDETLKTKYGGTNNNFSTASVPTVNNTKNLVYFNYDASLNHSLGSVSNDTLLWNVSTNRLSINRSSAATCTLDVGGDLRVQTIPDWTSSFSSTFNILGQNESDEKIYGIPSNTFLSYLSNNSLPSSRISGVVGLDKGGTNTDFTAFGAPSNGSVMFYSTATSGFITNPNFTWNTSSNILTIAGSVIHNAATDTSNNASLVGLDGTNKLVRLTANNTNNLGFSTVAVSGQSSVVADSNTSTVTLIPGGGINITTSATSDTITISSASQAIREVYSASLLGNLTVNTFSQFRYLFLDPNGANRNVFLSTTGATLSNGIDLVIQNTESNLSDNYLNVYSGTGTGLLIATLYQDYGDGITDRTKSSWFVFDGTNWRPALEQHHYAPYSPSVP